MKKEKHTRQTLLTTAVLSTLTTFAGTTCTDGVMRARPVKDGRPPVIDGKFDDWDLSGVVRCWNAEAYAEQQNCSLALMYDDDALYLAVEMTFAGRDAQNPNRPQDRYWYGDCVQFRLCTDPKLGYPLPLVSRKDPNSSFVKNPAVNCVNVWRDTKNGTDNLYFTPGALFDCPNTLNPAGSEVKIVTPDGKLRAEAKMSWKALGVASGKNPFKVGETMAGVFDVKWSPGKDGNYTAAVYRKDPGAFAFLNQNTWGQIAFTKADEKLPKVPSYAEVARGATGAGPRDGARIAFTLPKKAKVSVNILDEKGGVVRELAGGEPHDAGEVEFYWDGRDARGFPCETGKAYRWAAYAHDGLDVEYFGTVGTSGTPPYDTPDGKGGWGGDHGPVVAAAADDTGRYFVWNMSESGKAIVKTDFDGKVIWRATPFVGGGYGPFTAAVAKDGVLSLVLKWQKTSGLVRVDAATGNYLLYPDNTGLADIGLTTDDVAAPEGCAVRPEYFFNCAGLAAIGDELFAGDYAGGCIRVVEAKTGKVTRTLPCVGVRGLVATKDGNLLAACLQPGRVVKVDPKTGAAETVLEVKDGLVAPYGVAIDAKGAIYVSDLGTSQQVKKFVGRRLVYAVGKAGGRGALGRIDFDALRYPFGLAVDRTGALLVTEAAPPKIVRVLDAVTGKETRRYFGYTAYSPTNVPDCDDPLLQYYSLSGPDCFARARIPAAGGIGEPDACWDFGAAGFETGSAFNTMLTPQVVRLANGAKYLVPDAEIFDRQTKKATMIVCKIDGDTVQPAAGVLYEKEKKTQKYRLWSDENGDGLVQDGECSAWRACRADGRAFSLGGRNGAVQMDAAGNLFLAAGKENFMVGIPADGFTACGAPRWKADAAYVAVPQILPGAKTLFSTWRAGPLGTRRDAAGNFYTVVNGSPKYVTAEYEKYLHQGMGHTADTLGTYVVKHDAKGEPVWCVGRKAVGMLKPGEMLHHWCIAGMVGDDYVVAASEWGVFTVYTTDGFYVDRLFDAPGLPGRGIPYTFGGEDFSGQVAYFPQRDEVWAYNAGHTFRVTGFEKGRVKGEWRTSGTVALDKVLPLVFPGAKERSLTGVKLARKDGKVVYTAHVADATPLVNVARGAADVFKGGDAVGFQMGPATAPKELPERRPSGRKTGFARVLAARVGGADRVFAFKPFVAAGEKKPVEYATPAGGTSAFEFVGEVPGAKVAFTPDADGKGYAVRIEVPEAFFELDFAKNVFFDAEALFSGDGGRGLQTVRREWLHTPDSSEATMVDDVPTEARLRPKGWQRVAW
jgi:hypothetical protein